MSKDKKQRKLHPLITHLSCQNGELSDETLRLINKIAEIASHTDLTYNGKK